MAFKGLYGLELPHKSLSSSASLYSFKQSLLRDLQCDTGGTWDAVDLAPEWRGRFPEGVIQESPCR